VLAGCAALPTGQLREHAFAAKVLRRLRCLRSLRVASARIEAVKRASSFTVERSALR